MGAAFIFTIGRRYKKQASDVLNTPYNIPLYNYLTINDLTANIPQGCQIIGVELHTNSTPIKNFTHPDKCIYLLGAEDSGLSNMALNTCHKLVQLPGNKCLNVAVAGSIIMYDRINKLK